MKRLIMIPIVLVLVGALAFTAVAAGPSEDEEDVQDQAAVEINDSNSPAGKSVQDEGTAEETVEDDGCVEFMRIDRDGNEGVDVYCIDVDELPDQASSPGSFPE